MSPPGPAMKPSRDIVAEYSVFPTPAHPPPLSPTPPPVPRSRLRLRLIDLAQPGNAKLVDPLAELFPPALFGQRHRDGPAGTELLEVTAEHVPVVPAEAQRAT